MYQMHSTDNGMCKILQCITMTCIKYVQYHQSDFLNVMSAMEWLEQVNSCDKC